MLVIIVHNEKNLDRTKEQEKGKGSSIQNKIT